MRDLAVRQMGF